VWCVPLLYIYYAVRRWNNFWNWWAFGKVTDRTVDGFMCPIHLAAFFLRDAELAKQVEQIVYCGQKLLLIALKLIVRLMWVYCQQTSNCCRPVLTYWLTDWRHQWLTDCRPCSAFCRDVFSLLQKLWTVGHAFSNMADVNIFLLGN